MQIEGLGTIRRASCDDESIAQQETQPQPLSVIKRVALMKNTSTLLNPIFERTTALLARRFGAALLALLVSACSAAPSESEIKDALQRQFGNVMAGGPMGDTMKIDVKSVDKLAWERSGDAFVCDVETEMFSKLTGSTGKKSMRLRMIKGKDGAWRAVLN